MTPSANPSAPIAAGLLLLTQGNPWMRDDTLVGAVVPVEGGWKLVPATGGNKASWKPMPTPQAAAARFPHTRLVEFAPDTRFFPAPRTPRRSPRSIGRLPMPASRRPG